LSFADFLSENAFKSAGLNQTVVFDEYAEPLKNRVIGYAVDGTLTDYQFRTAGGGGIFSNVADLYLWHKILSYGDLMEERVIEMAYKPTILENDSIVYYGAGWKIDPLDHEHVFHTGTLEGFRTYFDHKLNNGQVIILLSNNSSEYLEDIVDEIRVSFPQSYQE
jgi:CubicO group peptidase (beta-lactamase class C family)